MIALMIFVAYPTVSFGHARIKSSAALIPRSSSDGLKTGPCGGVPRTNSAKTFAPGETITLNWEETINHPGQFEFYFSLANDVNFTLLKTVVDDKDSTTDLPHQYSTTLTLPNVSCDQCTLQMIQLMTDRNPPTRYYSCSDIVLSGDTSKTPPPSPTPPPKNVECPK
jgi:hypothetical protein